MIDLYSLTYGMGALWRDSARTRADRLWPSLARLRFWELVAWNFSSDFSLGLFWFSYDFWSSVVRPERIIVI